MDSLYFEAYRFYKKRYAQGLVLFHVGSQFEAYEDDAICLSKSFNAPLYFHGQLKYYRFPDDMLDEVVSHLVQATIPVHIIEFRDSFGAFVVPKVNQVLKDMEDDY